MSITKWVKEPVELDCLATDAVIGLLALCVVGTLISKPVASVVNVATDAGATAVSAIQQGNNPVAAIANSGDNFERVMKFISRVEGGWSNHPSDTGGATKYGITSAVASRHGLSVRDITMNQAKEIYRKDYWIPSGASAAQWPLNLAIMNSYVNSGRKWQITGSTPAEQAINYINQQDNYYRQIMARNPSQGVFSAGWFRRTKFMADAAKGADPKW